MRPLLLVLFFGVLHYCNGNSESTDNTFDHVMYLFKKLLQMDDKKSSKPKVLEGSGSNGVQRHNLESNKKYIYSIAHIDNLERSRYGFLPPFVTRGFQLPSVNHQSRNNLFSFTTYFGSCPVDSRKVAHRLDSRYLCRTGGNDYCNEECERRFDDEDEAVLGGLCLSHHRHSYGRGYGTFRRYTGYGGTCVCYYCRGDGLNATTCADDLVAQVLDDDESDRPLCNLQSNIFNENNDFKVVRSYPSGPVIASTNGDNRHYPISSRRCNDKCLSKYSNSERGTCRRRVGYGYVCVCITCMVGEQFVISQIDSEGVNCLDLNPKQDADFIIFLPVLISVSQGPNICGNASFVNNQCYPACVAHFTHHLVINSLCDDFARCQCHLCEYPPCIYDTWNDWSYCNARCNGGTRRRKRDLITGNRQTCTNRLQYRSCAEYPCAVDCEVSDWGGWNRCHGYCGVGEESRRRSIVVPPLYGGRCYYARFLERRLCDTGVPCYRTKVEYPKSVSKDNKSLNPNMQRPKQFGRSLIQKTNINPVQFVMSSVIAATENAVTN